MPLRETTAGSRKTREKNKSDMVDDILHYSKQRRLRIDDNVSRADVWPLLDRANAGRDAVPHDRVPVIGSADKDGCGEVWVIEADCNSIRGFAVNEL